jgi:hypothetical protein
VLRDSFVAGYGGNRAIHREWAMPAATWEAMERYHQWIGYDRRKSVELAPWE